MKRLLVVAGLLIAFGAVTPGVALAKPLVLHCQTRVYGCLRIEVVPALKHVSFTLETTAGKYTVTTHHNGVADVTGWKPGETAQLTINTPQVQGDGFVADFTRWSDESTSAVSRPITFPLGYEELVQAGFNTSYRVGREFLGPQGHVLNPSTISSVQIKRSDTMVIDPTTDTADCGGSVVDPCLLSATKLLNTANGLQPAPVMYSVQSVTQDGQNIVYAGANMFTCTWPVDSSSQCVPNGVWQIKTITPVAAVSQSESSLPWGIALAAVATLIIVGGLLFTIRRRIAR